MRRSIARIVFLTLTSALLISCSSGGNGSTSTISVTSGLTNRVLVSNACVPATIGGCTTVGQLNMIDANTDTLTTHVIVLGPQPGLMAFAGGMTLVFDSFNHGVWVVDRTTEAPVAGSPIPLPGFTESMVVRPDGLTGFAAVPSVLPPGATETGLVAVMNLASPAITSEIAVPQARRLALSPDGKKLLVFSDDSNTVTAIALPSLNKFTLSNGLPAFDFDRPVTAVFSSDSSKAYVLSCGSECGGTQAKVTTLDVTPLAAASPTAPAMLGLAGLPVSAATTGLVNGTTLYVAGFNVQGLLSVVNVASAPGSVAAPVVIGAGRHTLMALGTNNKLFIGARNSASSNCVFTGCLTIFDVVTDAVVIDFPLDSLTGFLKGEVTGMQPLKAPSSEVYVIEAGPTSSELRVYNTTTSTEIPGKIDIPGQPVDVKAIDQ